jgi:hypothetical protein
LGEDHISSVVLLRRASLMSTLALDGLARPPSPTLHPGDAFDIRITANAPHCVGFDVKLIRSHFVFRLRASHLRIRSSRRSSCFRPGSRFGFGHCRFTFPPNSMRRMSIHLSLNHSTFRRQAPTLHKLYFISAAKGTAF